MTSPLIEFTRGVPPPESFPIKELIECSQIALNEYGPGILQYASSYGFPQLRELIASNYETDMENVVIGQGSLQLLDHLMRIYPPGSLTIAIEEPSYDRAITIIRRTGAKVIPIPLDKQGMNLNVLKEALQSGEKIDYFYIIPDYQNPTGSLLPISIRRELIQLAIQYDFKIIEDSPYKHLRYSGDSYPSIFDLKHEAVIHMSSFSKLISPGLRVGFMILPNDLSKKLAKVAEDTYINPSYLNQAIVYEFCCQGFLENHLNYLIQLYKNRRDNMVSALKQTMNKYLDWIEPQGGFFVGSYLYKSVKSDDLLSAALENGIKLSDGRGFYINGGDNFIRLPFCALNEKNINEGINRLKNTLISLNL